MKKTLNYIFKGFTIFDVIYMVLALGLVIGFNIYTQFPVLPSIFACFMIVGVVFFSKDTYHGYGIAIAMIAFYVYFTIIYNLYSELIVSFMLFVPGVAVKLYKKIKNVSFKTDKFDKWDYIVYFSVLALVTYPVYLLLLQIEANYALIGAFSILVAFSILYLGMKHIGFRRYFYLIITALELVMFGLMVFQLDFTAISIAIGFLCVLIFSAVKMIARAIKSRKLKNNKEEVKEEQEEKKAEN